MDLRDGFEFLKQGFTQRTTVGAVWPSSKGLSRAMARPAFADRQGPLHLLEVGAGVGPFTAELVARMEPEDRLDVVELNPEFCNKLRDRFGTHPQISIHEKSILDFGGDVVYDHIVSGLPLANFNPDIVEAIYRKFFELLRPGGTFIMFEHILGREALSTLGTPANKQRIRRVMEFEKQLQPLEVGRTNILFNVPPARVRIRRRPALLTGS